MAGGRPLKDGRMYYSDEHRFVLAFCAKKANQRLRADCNMTVDPEELMEQGWWHCLRRLPPGHLQRGIHYTISAMVRWAIWFYAQHGLGAFPREAWAPGKTYDSEEMMVWLTLEDNRSGADDLAAAHEIAELLRDMLPDTYPDAIAMIGDGYDSTELAQQQGVTGQAIRYRRDRFLRDAREILGVVNQEE